MLRHDEDWMTMAYADVLTDITGKPRADALGMVNRMAGWAAKPYKVLHTAFTLGQLAFRPLAWGGRVLMEEGIRAELVGLPSMWTNPTRFMAGIMDARAIAKMPADMRGQARVVEGLIDAKLFRAGAPDFDAIKKIFPDIDELLDAAKINPSSTHRVRGFLAHELGKSLIGGEATNDARIGSRFNWARRTLLKSRRQQRAHRALDDAGMLKDFQWDIDAQDIVGRSLFTEFIGEGTSGYRNMEYNAGRMSSADTVTYGRGWGRSVFQMFGGDPLVRNYGLRRMIAMAEGKPSSYNAAKLQADPQWARIRPLVEQKFIEDFREVSDAAMAEWYLTHVVDEIGMTLLDHVVDSDIAERGRLARALLDRKTFDVQYGDGITHTIDLSKNNYEGVIKTFANITQSRNSLALPAPHKISAQMDMRLGQEKDLKGFFRRGVDWTMQKFGEDATQVLHRRPAYMTIHKRYYDYAIDTGATPEVARAIADEKAVETVNYIFFNNADIPEFLKKMNKVIPFFSAMWEVGQTWAYKIPAELGALGHVDLLRKVDRTLDGLVNAGIVTYDEDGNMLLRGDGEAGTFSQGLLHAVRAPAYLAEFLVGVGRMAIEPWDRDGVAYEPWKPADLSAWMKDGFTLAVGNPLDPTTNGLMAVNQLSIGPNPVLNFALSFFTETYAASDTQLQDVDAGTTLGEWAVANDSMEMADMLYLNKEAIIEANSPEAWKRAMSNEADPQQLKMPATIKLPKSSMWESLVDNFVFPFGTYESMGQVITSPSPAALQHVWRSFFTARGEPDSEIMATLFGKMSQYQATSEVIYSLQSLEATEGLASEIQALGVKRQELLAATEATIIIAPDGTHTLADPDHPDNQELLALMDEMRRLEEIYLARAHNNAFGTMFLRGLTGSLLPSTPRMFDRRQEQARAYWDQRELAEEATIRGSATMRDLIKTLPTITGDNFHQAANVVNAFMTDPSGDAARVWVRENNPSLEPFLQGKTYWTGDTPPPEALEFDAWIDMIESGQRVAFTPEVFVARMQRAAISVDKEIAIINQYTNNPDVAAQLILMDYDGYKDVIEEFDMSYSANEFLDTFLYEGRYEAWRNEQDNDNLSVLSQTLDRLLFMQDSVDATIDLLEYMDLSPVEERRIRGILSSGIREIVQAVRDLQDRDETWLNERELILAKYWTEISTPYHEGRTEIFNRAITPAENSRERSIGFDELRRYDNDHMNSTHTVEGSDGNELEMPNEMLRAWNAKPAKEKEERIYAILDKKPEWLNEFQTAVLLDIAPQLESMLPTTPEDWIIYDSANDHIRALQEAHEANPEEVTESELERQVDEVKEARDKWLQENGRGNEVGWREEWVPAQKLDYADLLPPAIVGAMPMLNSLLSALEAEEKSPTTNVGEANFLVFKEWLEGQYFPQNPLAKDQISELGLSMFNEPLYSAVLARLFQGDRFGKLE
jgi:hypothetical protein